MNEMLDGVRVFLALSFLVYASWSDWKKREVSNRVWIVWAPLAFALTALQFIIFAPELLYLFIFSFIITSALSVLLFYAGAFGGADAKALMCLSLALPYYPVYLLQPRTTSVSPLPLPITVFSNAVLLAALTVFYNIIRNSWWKFKTGQRLFQGLENESFWRKFLAFISGYKVQVTTLTKSVHLYPLEDITSKEVGDERRLVTLPKDENKEEIVARILNASEEGRIQSHVWATPGLPMLIFITAGLIVALTWGDLVWILLRAMWKI